MTTRLPKLIPPFRYAMVEEDLFRGGYPKPRNYRFLRRLRLKTILSLTPDKATPELQEFCKSENIHMLRLTVDRMKEDNIPLSYNKTILALQIIIDPENHPLYLHCLDGADVTGLVIACLRKLQMWSLSSALLEFSRNLHTSVITSEESEFIENFRNFEVTIPVSFRSWLWGGKVDFRKHSCLRLKFLNPEMMTSEERELKDKEERKEKDKEDFYKRRKNDLLDNLFDASASSSSRNNNNNNNSNTGGSSSSSGSSINAGKAQLTGSGTNSAIGSHSDSTVSSSAHDSKTASPSNGSDDYDFSSPKRTAMTIGDRYTKKNENEEERGEYQNDNSSDHIHGHESDVGIDSDDDNGEVGGNDTKVNDGHDGDLEGDGGDHDDTQGARSSSSSRRHGRSEKDQYMVDVGVDVEGVMMEGLDQVHYYNRSSTYFGDDTDSFYSGNNNNDDTMTPDELGIVYDDGPASRFAGEPISRTLEALALEGLD